MNFKKSSIISSSTRKNKKSQVGAAGRFEFVNCLPPNEAAVHTYKHTYGHGHGFQLGGDRNGVTRVARLGIFAPKL
jgi:hypothetical protein